MRIVKILMFSIGTLLAAALVIAVALGINGWNTLHGRQAHAIPALRIAPHDSSIARGRHLAEVQCVACHGSNARLPLSGGDHNLLEGSPLGVLHGSNLTPGGVLAQYSDGELSRAIREGVNREGRAMLVMPSGDLHGLSDHDLAALIAYMRSQPAVSREVPRLNLTPMAYLLLGLRVAETSVQHPIEQPVPHPTEDMTAAYGDYLATLLGCRACHGKALDGRDREPFTPEGPDLLKLASAHDLGAFARAVRGGRAMSDGHEMAPQMMPWPVFARLSDTEIGALYTLLQSRARR